MNGIGLPPKALRTRTMRVVEQMPSAAVTDESYGSVRRPTSIRTTHAGSFRCVQEHATPFADFRGAGPDHDAAPLNGNGRVTIPTGIAAKWKNRVDAFSRADAVVTR